MALATVLVRQEDPPAGERRIALVERHQLLAIRGVVVDNEDADLAFVLLLHQRVETRLQARPVLVVGSDDDVHSRDERFDRTPALTEEATVVQMREERL